MLRQKSGQVPEHLRLLPCATLRKNNLVLLILGYCFAIAHFGEKCFRLECGLPTLLHEEVLFPGRSQNHVRQSGINSGNHTAIPTPEIDFLAGVTLTHFTLCGMRQRSGWRLTEDVPTRIEQFRMARRTYQACVQPKPEPITTMVRRCMKMFKA
jgi:hypothetical protein